MPLPAPTPFEQKLHEIAEPIYDAGKTGYAWGAINDLLEEELGVPAELIRCKKATGSGRAANVFTESNDKEIDLYVIFIGHKYSTDAFLRVAEDRMGRFPNVKTAAIVEWTDGMWRVRSFVERAAIGLAAKLAPAFPAVGEKDIYVVFVEPEEAPDVISQLDSAPPPTVPAVDEAEFISRMLAHSCQLDGLTALPDQLVAFAQARGLVVDVSTAADLLASILSSQMVLFAGPSGTGKSSYARLLQSFFADDERAATIEARRQWLSPDDLFGYYSVLGQQFAGTPDTKQLIDLHEVSVTPASPGQDADSSPLILVEEINLSAPEGYLAPIVHGLSAIQAPFLRWPLHAAASAVDPASGLALPKTAMLGPYPRVLGTINVDATAHAPARKVAARSCVVLLEPEPMTVDDLVDLMEKAVGVQQSGELGPASAFLGNPLAALDALDATERETLATTLLAKLAPLGPDAPSRRDALRCLAYMAYYTALGTQLETNGDLVDIAAENAILHCVLPTLDADHFVPALQGLDGTLSAVASGNGAVGGQLQARVTRLLAAAESGFGLADAIDYWTALS